MRHVWRRTKERESRPWSLNRAIRLSITSRANGVMTDAAAVSGCTARLPAFRWPLHFSTLIASPIVSRFVTKLAAFMNQISHPLASGRVSVQGDAQQATTDKSVVRLSHVMQECKRLEGTCFSVTRDAGFLNFRPLMDTN